MGFFPCASGFTRYLLEELHIALQRLMSERTQSRQSTQVTQQSSSRCHIGLGTCFSTAHGSSSGGVCLNICASRTVFWSNLTVSRTTLPPWKPQCSSPPRIFMRITARPSPRISLSGRATLPCLSARM